MNEIMKTLTIISTTFLPLTFVVGIYGMNFHDIPEIYWDFGYIYVWALMIAIIIAMLFFFKKKKWM
jgi:magnesium transporter